MAVKISALPVTTVPTTADLVAVVQAGATDQITRGNFLKNIDADSTLTDITTNNVSTSKHGFAPKGDGSTTKFLNANGAYSTPASGGGWTLAASNTSLTGVNHVDFTNLGAYSEIMVFYRQVTFGSSDQCAVRVSSDNGSNFYSSSGDYVLLPSTGAESNNTGIFPQSAAATAARTGIVHIHAFNVASFHPVINPLRTDASGVPAEYISQTSAMNAVRVYSFSGNNFTGGGIYIFGR